MKQFRLTLRTTATIASGDRAAGARGRAAVWCAVPTDGAHQRIERCAWAFASGRDIFEYDPYTDAQGNTVRSFTVAGPTVRCEADVRLGLEHAQPPRTVRLGNASRFLRSESTLRRTPAVRALVRRLTRGVAPRVEQLRRIFRFVASGFTYEYPVLSRGVEHLDLTDLRGDCGEMSGLLVTLCRAVGIPARDETGFVLHPETGRVSEHGWASVLLADGSWADVDPQYASLETSPDAGEAPYFLRRSDWRVSFTHGYNVPLRPSVPSGHDLAFWNDLGLPLTPNSAQVLQPLLLTGPRIVRFTDDHHVEEMASHE